MWNRTRALLALCLAALVAPACRQSASAIATIQWEVTVAVRLTPTGKEPVAIRIAAPPDNARQRLMSVDVSPRGLEVTDKRQGEHPYLLLRGKLTRPRRAAVTYRVETSVQAELVPPIGPLTTVDQNLLPYLAPTPLLQSRSLLVREFLEDHVTATLHNGKAGLMQPILAATQREIQHRRDGKSLVLDTIRRRQARRIGIERTFTTFLRCAGIPARFVEGINLKSKTKHKQVFWTEAWSQGKWWPVSASEGWLGRLPARYLAMTSDGARVVTVEGPVNARYSVQAVRVASSQ
jgi:hypothetical protein